MLRVRKYALRLCGFWLRVYGLKFRGLRVRIRGSGFRVESDACTLRTALRISMHCPSGARTVQLSTGQYTL